MFKFSRVGSILNFLKVAFCNLTAFLHSSLNHGLLYFIEVELLGICSSAMFNSVFVKYKIFSSLFLLASGVSWPRHEVLKPSQLAFLGSSLEFFYSIHQWCFLIESESGHFHRCRHVLSNCNQETRKGHILIGLLQNMCLLLGADMCWIYCCTCTTDADLIKILILCPFLSVFLFPQISLWLLKSPIITKGLGSYSIKLFSSNSLGSSFGGDIY